MNDHLPAFVVTLQHLGAGALGLFLAQAILREVFLVNLPTGVAERNSREWQGGNRHWVLYETRREEQPLYFAWLMVRDVACALGFLGLGVYFLLEGLGLTWLLPSFS